MWGFVLSKHETISYMDQGLDLKKSKITMNKKLAFLYPKKKLLMLTEQVFISDKYKILI